MQCVASISRLLGFAARNRNVVGGCPDVTEFVEWDGRLRAVRAFCGYVEPRVSQPQIRNFRQGRKKSFQNELARRQFSESFLSRQRLPDGAIRDR